MPKGMIVGCLAGTIAALVAVILFGTASMTIPSVLFTVITAPLLALTIWFVLMYRASDYNGKRKMSKQIIEGIAAYVTVPDSALDAVTGNY